jgi:hypothetical protein
MTERAISVACYDLDISLGMGVYLHRRVFLSDFNPTHVPKPLVDASFRTTIAIVNKQRLILETPDSDRPELTAKLYLVDAPELLEHLEMPISVQGVTRMGVSIGAALLYFQEREFPKDVIRSIFG